MSIIREHIPYFKEIFQFAAFWQEPFLMIGLPIIEDSHLPRDFEYENLKALLMARGLKKISSLDLYDPKADLDLDLNQPVPKKYHHQYKVLVDFGTLEHVFDARQCLENYFRMLALNGLLVLNTAVNGYFGHGLHVFNPEGLKEALKLNNFKILYLKYTSSTGIEVTDPSIKKNILIWIVAKKKKVLKKFTVPQQKEWKKRYLAKSRHRSRLQPKTSLFDKLSFLFTETKRFVINHLPKNIRNFLYGRW